MEKMCKRYVNVDLLKRTNFYRECKSVGLYMVSIEIYTFWLMVSFLAFISRGAPQICVNDWRYWMFTINCPHVAKTSLAALDRLKREDKKAQLLTVLVAASMMIAVAQFFPYQNANHNQIIIIFIYARIVCRLFDERIPLTTKSIVKSICIVTISIGPHTKKRGERYVSIIWMRSLLLLLF